MLEGKTRHNYPILEDFGLIIENCKTEHSLSMASFNLEIGENTRIKKGGGGEINF